MQRQKPLTILLSIVIIFGMLFVIGSFADGALTASKEATQANYNLSSLPTTVTLHYQDQQFATPSASLISPESIEQFLPKRHGIEALEQLLFSTTAVPAKNPLDSSKIESWLNQIANSIDKPAIEPSISIDQKKTSVFTINPGQHGVAVNRESTLQTISALQLNASSSASIQTQETGTVLSPDQQIATEKRASLFMGAKVLLQAKNYTRSLSQAELFSLLSLPSGYSTTAMEKIFDSITKDVGTQPVEPELVIDNGVVTKFIAPKDGIGVDSMENKKLLQEALEKIEQGEKPTPIALVLTTQAPKTSLASTNTIGIEEKIGFGESTYSHSIANRIHNVGLTTSKIHAKLIQPGETFSFNAFLGDVSAKTGFKPAYVIKEGQTVLGDGGGVCQVSSTLFRAILNAGLPITERRGHSYRVSYYEQNSKPGFDATVYSPHPDLRFVNDTNSPILINALADAKKTYMYVELYGKSDGRKAEIANYKQWGARPAPAAVYQDDPTLKPGQIKQVEYAAPGLNTSFDYVVSYPSGEKKEQTFKTTYVPWRAVYLRGPQ
ncbi:VanW family protein [Candidatus Woesebacteria bacterium]|nr:VanW family protein [Candidatus Woesebacteria bacterium]